MSRSKKIPVTKTITAEQAAAQKTDTVALLLKMVFTTYVMLAVYGMLNHELWRDEAQAWLLATAPVSCITQ